MAITSLPMALGGSPAAAGMAGGGANWMQLLQNPMFMQMAMNMMGQGQQQPMQQPQQPMAPQMPQGRTTPIQFLPPPMSAGPQGRPPWWMMNRGGGAY